MPRLNQVDMTNVQLDEGKKIIPRLRWTPNTKDMLFILENGGGKTSFIQLVTQTIIPNSTLSGRDLKNVIAPNSYGHIVTEWRLDGDNPQYLCLGFSYQNGSKNAGIEYYMYFFTYNEGDEFTINKLPTVKEGIVNKFHQYKKDLKNTTKAKIVFPETIRNYHRDIRKYQILAEEWQSIQKINGDEGGVDEFFKKASSTETLLRNLLIPTVEQTIFGTDEKRKEIIRSFQSYKNNLLRIPEIKKDLDDFIVIEKHAQAVIDEVKKLENEKKSFNEEKTRLYQYWHTFDHAFQFLNGRIMEDNSVLNELRQNEKERQWKIRSYDVHLTHEEVKELKKRMDRILELTQILEAQHEQKVTLANQLEALSHYQPYLRESQDAEKYHAQIKSSEQSEPELKKSFDQAKEALIDAWASVYEEKHRVKLVKDKELKNILERLDKKERELKRYNCEHEQLTSLLAESKAKIDQYENERERIRQDMGDWSADKPTEVKNSTELEFAKVLVEKLQVEEYQIQIESEMENHRTLIVELGTVIQTHQHSIKKLEDEINQYIVNEREIKNQFEFVNRRVSNIHEEQESLTSFLSQKIFRLEEDRRNATHHLMNLRKDLQFWDGMDFFIPHMDLLELQNALADAGIYALLGSEYLSELSSDEEKRRFLELYPLLPYSILIEESQRNQIKQALRKIKGNFNQIPILFQIRNRMSLMDENPEDTFFYHVNDNALLFKNVDVQWFLSRDLIQKEVERIRGELEKHEILLINVEEEEKRHRLVLQQLTTFLSQYEIGFEDSRRGHLKITRHSFNEEMKRKNNLEKEVEMFKEQQIITKNKLNIIQDSKGEMEKKLTVLNRFIELYPAPERVYEKRKDLDVLKDQSMTKILEVEDEKDDIRDEEGSKKREIDHALNLIHQHEKVATENNIPKDVIAIDSYSVEEFEQILSRFLGISAHLTQRIGDIQHLRELHTKTLSNIAEKERLISKTPVPITNPFNLL